MRRLLVSVAIALASQEQRSTSPEDVFDRLDTDGDGMVSFDELEILPRSRFDALDRDGNGSLTTGELAALTADTAPSFEALDANGDERLQRDELPEREQHRFASLDGDHDGTLDRAEWQADELDEKRRRTRPAGMMRRLLELDVDGDGRLALDELPESMEFLRASFDRFDLDDDGFIDGRELRVMTEAPVRWHPRR